MHYIIHKSQSTENLQVAMHILNPHILIYMFLFPYSSYLAINIWPTMNLLPNTNSSYCAQTNVFVTPDCHGTQLFWTEHTFPYGQVYPTEEYYCHNEMPLKYWVIEEHFKNTLTYLKIIFVPNTSNPNNWQLFWSKILRGVIKDNEFFYFEDEVLFWLQVQLQARLFNHLLKL